MTHMEVVKAGVQTTVQDYPGRWGLRARGFFPAGPMDHFALRAANRVVGNPESAAGLEITLGQVELRFADGATVALCGPDARFEIDGDDRQLWRAWRVGRGGSVRIGLVRSPGFRVYLAVSGGIDVPPLLGSRATYTMGRLGGFQGRALEKGDRLPLGAAGEQPDEGRGAARAPDYPDVAEIAVMPGPQASPDFLTDDDMDVLLGRTWQVDQHSNRTGVRLESYPFAWARSGGGIGGGHPSNVLDHGYPVGGININGDLPVILGPDGPTAGGFIVAATVIHADAWKLGQLRPGSGRVRFRAVTIDEARQAAAELDAALADMSPRPRGPH
jgi:5-oxoprolinase (ATP-hydrolysing) subunit C